MKNVLISIICLFLLTGMSFAKGKPSKFQLGVRQYKTGNYIGSMQTMEEVVAADPGNALAHYYLAISYVRVGNKDAATKEYNSVISLNPDVELVSYAKKGLGYLSGETAAPATSTTPPTLPDVKDLAKPATTEVDNLIKTKKLESIKEIMNQNQTPDSETLRGLDKNIPQKSVSPTTPQTQGDLPQKKSDNSTPSKEEIANAIATLAKAGLGQNNMNINPEALQMNMLMGAFGGNGMNNGMGNSGYNPASMLPLLMMSQNSGNGNKNIDPQVIETLITGMMMPGLNMNSNNENNNY